MADGDRQNSFPRGERGPREGGNREGGNRDAGGFRIRLSDNEMRSARAVQEAFGLRSTVAALGLSIRTVAQLLEEGKLDDVVAQHRANAGSRPGGGGDGGERPANNRPNPFARPARPAAPAPEPEPEPAAEPVEAIEAAELDSELAAEAATQAANEAATEAAPETATEAAPEPSPEA
jgi:hypothetical protein